jgi:hypothetical protein
MPKQLNNQSQQLEIFPSEANVSSNNNLWLTVTYQPVSLFSLKRSDATSMAARSNLVPTPYAIKMALLKVLLESQGQHHQEDFDSWIKQEFTWIRDLTIYLKPPELLVVNRNGYKLRYYDQTTDKAEKTRPTVPMQDGFVFREWIYFQGNFQICCGETNRLDELQSLFCLLNYFGKKSCFFQYLPEQSYPHSQPQFTPDYSQSFTVQLMDDFGDKTTFDKLNPFSSQRASLGKDRVIKPGLLPLKLTKTNPNYDYYQQS